MKPSRSLLNLVIATSVFVAGNMLLVGAAQAADCKVDSDCGEGYRCKITDGGEPSPCPPGVVCDVPIDTPSESVGVCQKTPISCQSNADCPSHTRCEEEYTVTCLEPACPGGDCSNTTPACSQPDAIPLVCRAHEISCSIDSDCPDDFECRQSNMGSCSSSMDHCTSQDDCEPVVHCERSDEKICQPKLIGCESNTQCPSLWTCTPVPETASDCFKEPSVSDGDEPATSSPGQPAADCQPLPRNFCMPPGYESGVRDSMNLSAERDATSRGAGANASRDDGGCSVANVGTSNGSSALLTMLGLGFVTRLASRRSRLRLMAR